MGSPKRNFDRKYATALQTARFRMLDGYSAEQAVEYAVKNHVLSYEDQARLAKYIHAKGVRL